MRHNHTFFFHVYRRSSSGSFSGALSLSTLLLDVGTCHAFTRKLASPPVLPRCVFTFSIFLYILCPHHPSLSSFYKFSREFHSQLRIHLLLHFCKFSQEFHSQFRIHLLLHFYTTLICIQNLGVFWQEYANAMMLATYRVLVGPREHSIHFISRRYHSFTSYR